MDSISQQISRMGRQPFHASDIEPNSSGGVVVQGSNLEVLSPAAQMLKQFRVGSSRASSDSYPRFSVYPPEAAFEDRYNHL